MTDAGEEGIGDRIAERQRATGVSNIALAKAIGVSRQAVSMWRSGTQTPSEENLQAMAPVLKTTVAYLRYGTSEYEPSDGGNNVVKEGAVVLGALSQRLRIWLQEFLLELAKGGATDHEIESARRALTSPEMFEFYHGGRRGSPLSEEELMVEMQAVATGIRKVLRMRGRDISES